MPPKQTAVAKGKDKAKLAAANDKDKAKPPRQTPAIPLKGALQDRPCKRRMTNLRRRKPS
jgi:hypothetical protein